MSRSRRSQGLDGRAYPIVGAIADGAWAEDAVCKGHVHLFFGSPLERPEARAKREHVAKQLCAECPVTTECRDAGRRNREDGIWGGETEEDRALAGFAPRGINRRSVAAARRKGLEAKRVG